MLSSDVFFIVSLTELPKPNRRPRVGLLFGIFSRLIRQPPVFKKRATVILGFVRKPQESSSSKFAFSGFDGELASGSGSVWSGRVSEHDELTRTHFVRKYRRQLSSFLLPYRKRAD